MQETGPNVHSSGWFKALVPFVDKSSWDQAEARLQLNPLFYVVAFYFTLLLHQEPSLDQTLENKFKEFSAGKRIQLEFNNFFIILFHIFAWLTYGTLQRFYIYDNFNFKYLI